MFDLTITANGELDVTQVEGNTEEGQDFVDQLFLPTMQVVDSGRIIVPSDVVTSIREAAQEKGLTIEDA